MRSAAHSACIAWRFTQLSRKSSYGHCPPGPPAYPEECTIHESCSLLRSATCGAWPTWWTQRPAPSCCRSAASCAWPAWQTAPPGRWCSPSNWPACRHALDTSFCLVSYRLHNCNDWLMLVVMGQWCAGQEAVHVTAHRTVALGRLHHRRSKLISQAIASHD